MNTVMDRFRSTSSSRPASKPHLAPLPLRREASAEALLERNTQNTSSEPQVPKNKHKPMSLLDVFSRSSSASPVSPASPLDRLPNDPAKLDGILNYHLSQLDRIQREVMAHNATIEQLSYTFSDILMNPDLRYTADRLSARIQGVRNARNLLAKFVAYHLQEIERASTMKRVLAGSRDIPDIFRHLPTDYEWNEMFSH